MGITSISANCFKIKSLHIVNCQQKIEPFFPHNQLIMASYPVQQIYYDGKPQSAKSGKTFKTVDPSTAKPLADVQTASPADIDSAIASAQAAFPSWSQTPPIVRSRILLKAVSLLRSRNDEIAKVETHDTGKAFSETSTVDVVTGADVLEYFANLVASAGTQWRDDTAAARCVDIYQEGSSGSLCWHRRLELSHSNSTVEISAMLGSRKLHGL